METSREYGRGLLRGICRYNAMHKHWRIEQQALAPDMSPEVRRQSPLDTADGVIMRDYRGCPALLKKGIPIVFAAHFHKDIRGSHRILSDDASIGRMAAAHLLERGFRRFAFVGYDGLYWSRQRGESFSRTIADAGRECRMFKQAKDLRLRVWRREQKVLADWLKTLPRPAGLMACDDERARQVVDACAAAGLAVPEDIAIVGVDNDEFICSLSNPQISSVSLGLEEAGYQAAMLLDRLMAAKRREDERTSVNAHGQARTAASVGGREGPCSSVRSSMLRRLPTQILVPPVAVVARPSSDTTAIEDPVVSDALRFIRQNCDRPIRISDVLSQVTISRRSLFDRFKQTVGCTIPQYIKKARVARIEAMLLNTSHSVGEIAEMLGFSSSDHVAAYFRSVRGMNPRVFRVQFPVS